MSYAGKLNFGFTGARDTLPHMQHLAVYTGEALAQLEEIAGETRASSRSEGSEASANATA